MFDKIAGTMSRAKWKTLPLALTAAALAFGSQPAPAPAQVPSVGPGRCVANCPGSGRTTSSPTYRGRSVPRGPSRQELERKRAVSFYDASEKGYAAYERGDWPAAIFYFKDALSYAPHNPTMIHNLRRARERQAQALAAAKRRREAAARRRARAEAERRRKAAALRKALEEAKAAKAHGKTARGMTADQSRKEAQKVFDVKGKKVATSSTGVVDLRGMGRPVEIPPALKNHPQIRKIQKEREKLVDEVKRLEERLASIRKKKAGGKENKGRLEVEEAKTKQEISNVKSKIGVADVKMKSFVITLTRESQASKKP